MTRRLLLVRHGVTTWNLEDRFQGHLDPPLDASGVLEARLLAERLAAEQSEPMRVVTSPLQRAVATARALVEALAAAGATPELTEDARLVEIGQGEWEGRTHRELEAGDAERYAAWRIGGGATQPPGAESVEDAQQRVTDAIEDLAHAATATCLVSHGGILRLAARDLLGLELERAWAMDVDNASLSRLTSEGGTSGWRLDLWNDTAHLLGRTPLHLDEADGTPLAL